MTSITLATGAFVVAALFAGIYLLADRHAKRAAAGLPTRADAIFRILPIPRVIDQLAYRTVLFGFPLWTFGIIAGAIWADEAWGRYWGWDPTETWAFITWVVYAGYLHARATAGWRGRKSAYIQLIGFGCLLFNTIVVSILVKGLHSYAGLADQLTGPRRRASDQPAGVLAPDEPLQRADELRVVVRPGRRLRRPARWAGRVPAGRPAPASAPGPPGGAGSPPARPAR